MSSTDHQLAAALETLPPELQTFAQALLNRVTVIVAEAQTTERGARLVLADKVAALEDRLLELEGGPGRHAAE